MDVVTRINCEESIRTIVGEMLGRPYVCAEPDKEGLYAITDAVNALQEWQTECPALDFCRHIAVLNYHILQPRAILFKDRYTMAALRAGVQALEHKLGKRVTYEEVKTK